MRFEQFVKSFLSGMAFPAVFLPLAYGVLYLVETEKLLEGVFQFIPMYLPILFGMTNVLYIWVGERCPIKSVNPRLWVTGGLLGFIVAIFGVLVFHVPQTLFDLSYGAQYAPIIILPIIYGAIFRYVVKWLNSILSIPM